jgi:hypothetical protein
MARLKKIEILRNDLLEHPSVRAWSELGPRRVEPEQIEVLKGEKKSSVFRLAGVGPGNSAVIAKRCRQAIADVERAIYEDVLPDLPVTTPRYYGAVEEHDDAFSWLFLEDAAGDWLRSGSGRCTRPPPAWPPRLGFPIEDRPTIWGICRPREGIFCVTSTTQPSTRKTGTCSRSSFPPWTSWSATGAEWRRSVAKCRERSFTATSRARTPTFAETPENRS